ncbi:hypothetical protein ACFL2E_05050 [Thermodesulfobacteriota bacterium]
MAVTKAEKDILDLIAKYSFLTDCKDTGLLDLNSYAQIVYRFGERNMERIKYYMQRLDEHHNDTRAFLDNLIGNDQ